MRNVIRERLAEIAGQRRSRVIFACESGSRAWNIASPDSDYDVRFIYVSPRDRYLSLIEERDTIEVQEKIGDDVLDYHGWDLRKALLLGAKSNPSLLEWFASDIVYEQEGLIMRKFRNAMIKFSPRALMHHYISLAERQVKAYWKEGEPVRLKKYLYAVRPVLCVRWMVNHDYAMPPMDFELLYRRQGLAPEIYEEIDKLLRMKRESSEIDGAGRFPVLDEFIGVWLANGHKAADLAPHREPSMSLLQEIYNRAFYEIAIL